MYKMRTEMQIQRDSRLAETVRRLGTDTCPAGDPHDVERTAFVLREENVSLLDFMHLDEHPGQWGYRGVAGEWHWRVRRFRNSSLFPSFFSEA